MSSRNIKRAGVILTNERNEYLVVLGRRWDGPPIWSFPKGHREERETLAECAVREMLEESGVTVRLSEPKRNWRCSGTVYFFIGPNNVMNCGPIRDHNEVIQTAYKSLDELEQLGRSANIGIRKFIEEKKRADREGRSVGREPTHPIERVVSRAAARPVDGRKWSAVVQ